MEHVTLDKEFKWLSSKFKSVNSNSERNIPLAIEDFNLMPNQEIIRLCFESHIDMYKALALILKKEWESLLTSQKLSHQKKCGTELKNRFNPDAGLIFDTFEMQDAWASREGYSIKTFDTLVHEMILSDMHLVAGNSIELERFIADARKPLHLLNGHSKEKKEAFWIKKNTWLQLQETLSENLLLLERRRLENANITQKWMIIFGKEYLELQRQNQRYSMLKLKFELLEAYSGLSRQELEQKVREIKIKMKNRLKELHFQVLIAPHLCKFGGSGNYDFSKISDFRTEQKKILRDLWLLIHPDQLQNNDGYEKLTDSQKKQLEDLWHRTMKIRPEEIGFDENQIGFEYRSLSVLTDLLASAKVILENAGIDTNVDYIIQGDTIDEQLEWIQHSNQRLEIEIESVLAELKVLLEDKEILERAALLSCQPEQQQKVKSEMLDHSNKYQQDADRLEQQLKVRFKEV
ncbi:MAG: hypothetical protein ABIJ59_01935 [Pseudomonadota bacterium]